MEVLGRYESPLGEIMLAGEDEFLTGLWFEGQRFFASGVDLEAREAECAAFREARRWLDVYFAGEEPRFLPSLRLAGTPFQREIWELLLRIPYGETVTYGALARAHGRAGARAVGSAVARNRISIIVPCHRVVGAGGRLTGYAGGLWRKERLLELEGRGRCTY